MLRPVIKITIQQKKSDAHPERVAALNMDFVNSYEVESSWEQLTDTAKVIFPKNIIATDINGEKYSLYGTRKGIGSGKDNILFLRGDQITIEAGYRYKDGADNDQTYLKQVFRGYITKVHSKIPLELDCENNAWLLKQTAAPDKAWPKTTSLNDVLQELLAKVNSLHGSNLQIPQDMQTELVHSMAGLVTRGETVSQVLARLNKETGIKSFFIGDELIVGYRVFGNDSKAKVNGEASQNAYFTFQENIVSSSLEYVRYDDVVLSAIATSRSTDKDDGKTKDGQQKMKTTQLEMLVYMDPDTKEFKYKLKDKNKPFPDAEQGERYTFLDKKSTTDPEVLFSDAKDFLQGYYFEGFEGSFTTFGYPFVRFGDSITLIDKLYPDRNGKYKVKKVIYKGGTGGIRQELFLDYKFKTPPPEPNTNQTLL